MVLLDRRVLDAYGVGVSASSRSPLLSLVFLESLVLELERSGVLGDRADHAVGRPVRQLRLDLQRQGDASVPLGGEMLDNLLGDAAGVAAKPVGVERDRAVESPHDQPRRRLRRGNDARTGPP